MQESCFKSNSFTKENFIKLVENVSKDSSSHYYTHSQIPVSGEHGVVRDTKQAKTRMGRKITQINTITYGMV